MSKEQTQGPFTAKMALEVYDNNVDETRTDLAKYIESMIRHTALSGLKTLLIENDRENKMLMRRIFGNVTWLKNYFVELGYRVQVVADHQVGNDVVLGYLKITF